MLAAVREIAPPVPASRPRARYLPRRQVARPRLRRPLQSPEGLFLPLNLVVELRHSTLTQAHAFALETLAVRCDNATGEVLPAALETLARESLCSPAAFERAARELLARDLIERRKTYLDGHQGWSCYRLTFRWSGLYAVPGSYSGCVPAAAQGEPDLSAPDPDLPPEGDPDPTHTREGTRPGVVREARGPEAEPWAPQRQDAPLRAPSLEEADQILAALRAQAPLACLASRTYALRLLELAVGTPEAPGRPAVAGLGLDAVLQGLHEVSDAAEDARAALTPWDQDRLRAKIRTYCKGARPAPEQDRSGHDRPPQRQETPMQDPSDAPPPVAAGAPFAAPSKTIAELVAGRPMDDLLALVATLKAEGSPFGAELSERICERGGRITPRERAALERIREQRATGTRRRPLVTARQDGTWTPASQVDLEAHRAKMRAGSM